MLSILWILHSKTEYKRLDISYIRKKTQGFEAVGIGFHGWFNVQNTTVNKHGGQKAQHWVRNNFRRTNQKLAAGFSGSFMKVPSTEKELPAQEILNIQVPRYKIEAESWVSCTYDFEFWIKFFFSKCPKLIYNISGFQTKFIGSNHDCEWTIHAWKSGCRKILEKAVSFCPSKAAEIFWIEGIPPCQHHKLGVGQCPPHWKRKEGEKAIFKIMNHFLLKNVSQTRIRWQKWSAIKLFRLLGIVVEEKKIQRLGRTLSREPVRFARFLSIRKPGVWVRTLNVTAVYLSASKLLALPSTAESPAALCSCRLRYPKAATKRLSFIFPLNGSTKKRPHINKNPCHKRSENKHKVVIHLSPGLSSLNQKCWTN